ncbi:MAG: hypothetical protein CMA59_01440, partial [Euryarchaeota archaeon]|nr:hypothetical protein [Euryarchaeota archaeon]
MNPVNQCVCATDPSPVAEMRDGLRTAQKAGYGVAVAMGMDEAEAVADGGYDNAGSASASGTVYTLAEPGA